MNYNDQIKADRKAAALARRAERAAGFLTEVDERKALYVQTQTQTKPETMKIASINRRNAQRTAHLATLGNFNDSHSFLLQELSEVYTNDELLAMGRGQTAMLYKFDRMIVNQFALTPFEVAGIADDALQADNMTGSWIAWFMADEQVAEVKQFIHQIVADHKAAA